MKRIAALALGHPADVRRRRLCQQSVCRAEAKERHLSGAAFKAFVARCEKALAACDSAAKSRTSRPRMSPADEEKLDRAMRRNILQSIEDELRAKRIGK